MFLKRLFIVDATEACVAMFCCVLGALFSTVLWGEHGHSAFAFTALGLGLLSGYFLYRIIR